MTTEIALPTPMLPGIAPDVEALGIAKAYLPAIEDYGQGKLALPKMPTPQERAILEQRFADLTREFRPLSYSVTIQRHATEAFARVFAGFTSLRKEDAVELSGSYVMLLLDLPLFAVELACLDAQKGHIKNVDLAWPPTGPQMYQAAERYRDKLWRDEYQPVDRVLRVNMLSPPRTTAASDAIVAPALKKLAEEIGSYEDAVTKKALANVTRENLDYSLRNIREGWARSPYEMPEMKPGFEYSVELALANGATLKKKRGGRR